MDYNTLQILTSLKFNLALMLFIWPQLLKIWPQVGPNFFHLAKEIATTFCRARANPECIADLQLIATFVWNQDNLFVLSFDNILPSTINFQSYW